MELSRFEIPPGIGDPLQGWGLHLCQEGWRALPRRNIPNIQSKPHLARPEAVSSLLDHANPTWKAAGLSHPHSKVWDTPSLDTGECQEHHGDHQIPTA